MSDTLIELERLKSRLRDVSIRLERTESELGIFKRTFAWRLNVFFVAVVHFFYILMRFVYLKISMSRSLQLRLIPYVSRISSWFRRQGVKLSGEIYDVDGYSSIHYVNELPPCSAPFDIYIFSNIDWEYRMQRPQHLALELGKLGYRVFFVSSSFIDTLATGIHLRTGPINNVILVKMHAFGRPLIYYQAPSQDVNKQLSDSYRSLLVLSDKENPVIIIQHPFWHSILQNTKQKCLIYDCIDYHYGFGNVMSSIVDLEHSLICDANFIVATSKKLIETHKAETKKHYIIRNASDFDFFSKKVENTMRLEKNKSVLGYYGAISDWFDLDLLAEIAKKFPECLCVLVGQDTVNAKNKLEPYPNVLFVGEVSYSELPFYLYRFDVCLLPFINNLLTESTNPLKVYEYLSAGKPVVAIDLPEMAHFGDIVYVSNDIGSFISNIRKSLAEKGDEKLAARRRLFASQQTWRMRALDFERAIKKELSVTANPTMQSHLNFGEL